MRGRFIIFKGGCGCLGCEDWKGIKVERRLREGGREGEVR